MSSEPVEGSEGLPVPEPVNPFACSDTSKSPFGSDWSDGKHSSPFDTGDNTSPFSSALGENPFSSSTGALTSPFGGAEASSGALSSPFANITLPTASWSPTAPSPTRDTKPMSPFATVEESAWPPPSDTAFADVRFGSGLPDPEGFRPDNGHIVVDDLSVNFEALPVLDLAAFAAAAKEAGGVAMCSDAPTVDTEDVSTILSDGHTEVLRAAQEAHVLDLPSGVLAVAAVLGEEVFEEAKALESDDLLGRVQACVEYVKRNGLAVPAHCGSILLSACIDAGDERGLDLSLELVKHVAPVSYFCYRLHTTKVCTMCIPNQKNEEDMDEAYWIRIHCIHKDWVESETKTGQNEAEDAKIDDESHRLHTARSSLCRNDSNDVAASVGDAHPILSACQLPLYLPLVEEMLKRLRNDVYQDALMSYSKLSSAGTLPQLLFTLSCELTLQTLLSKNYRMILGCLAYEMRDEEMRNKQWKGKQVAFRLAVALLDELDGAEKNAMMAAMTEAMCDAVRHEDDAVSSKRLAPLLEEVSLEFVEWMFETHIYDESFAPLSGTNFDQLLCPLLLLLGQMLPLKLLRCVELIGDSFRAQLKELNNDQCTQLLISTIEYDSFETLRALVCLLSPLALVRKQDGRTAVARLFDQIWYRRSTIDYGVCCSWLGTLTCSLYLEQPDVTVAFFEETGDTVLERVCRACPAHAQRRSLFTSKTLTFEWTWVQDLLQGLADLGRDDIVEREIAHCYDFVFLNGGENLIDKYFSDGVRELFPSRVLISMMLSSLDLRKDLALFGQEVFKKIDNEEHLTPLAVFVLHPSAELARLIFDACPAAMCVQLPQAGSALHLLISRHVSLEFLEHVLSSLEERDFFLYPDQYGNNVLHVAALSSASRETVTLLRSTMPVSVANAVNNAGQTPLDLYLRVGQHKDRDLTDLFTPSSMAKGALS